MTHPPPTLHRPGATSGMSRASAMRRLLPPLLVGFIVIDAAGSVDTGLQVLTPQPRPDAGGRTYMYASDPHHSLFSGYF